MITNYKGRKYTLKGKKCVLGDIKEKDLPNFVRWFTDKEVNKYIGRDFSGLTLKKEKKWYEDTKKSKNTITFGLYALEKNKTILIGSTSFKDIDLGNKRAEFGVGIGDKTYWGKGIGTEAAKLMINFGFRTLKLNSIYLIVSTKNKAGQKAYKRVGFKNSGLLREHVKYKWGFDDVFVMNILKKEWKK